MGLFTGLITLPLAPMRGVVWIADKLADEARRQWTDPAAVRLELERVHQQWVDGELTDAERDAREDALLERLVEAQKVSSNG